MHSLCDARVSQILKSDEDGTERQNFGEFTKNHFIRIFPSHGDLSKPTSGRMTIQLLHMASGVSWFPE
jgi:hypothetical protein